MDYKEEAAALNRKEVGTVSAACVCQPQMCCVGLCLWQLDRDESETEEGRQRRGDGGGFQHCQNNRRKREREKKIQVLILFLWEFVKVHSLTSFNKIPTLSDITATLNPGFFTS